MILKTEPRIKFRAAEFDIDGTVLDSMGLWDTAGERYLIAMGYTPEPDINVKIKKMTVPQAAAYMKETYGLPRSVEEIRLDIEHRAEEVYLSDAPLKKGAPELLELLRKNGVRIIAATANERSLVTAGLRRTGVLDYFEEVISCSALGVSKKTPDIYLHSAELLEASPSETLVFEDSAFAAEVARTAGFPVIGVYDRYETEFELLRKVSDLYINDFFEFINLLEIKY